MKVDLGNFQGNISKTATIVSNDPSNPLQVLKLQGIVKGIVTIKPSPTVALRASTGPLSQSVLDLEATTAPFHIKSIDTNLPASIAYSLQTVSDGTHYRLKVSNKIPVGTYTGFIRLKTDLPKTPYVLVRVLGIIRGEISAAPETVMIGELSAGKPVRDASVKILGSDGKPFKITGLTYDKTLMSVSREKLDKQNGFLLTIQPRLEGAKAGAVSQASLTVQTDAKPDGDAHVLVLIFNNSSNPGPPH